ncbi:MAG: Cellulose synthase catalytic subunit [Actinomycetota bacterium]|jgi:hypothetical protein
MRKNEHLAARVLAVTGLLGGVAYLGWRLVASMDQAPPWLAGPFFAVEVVGLLATMLLTWALWPAPDTRRGGVASPTPVDVVVRSDGQPAHELRATLLALRDVRGVAGVIVVDHAGCPHVAALAQTHGALYAATDPADHNGLGVMRAAVRTPEFLLLDAGDVPADDIVERLALDLADPDVAVVQGLGVTLTDDSPEHGPDGRHELTFERSALNPALGRRGVAVWTGSGALVRAHALAVVPEVADGVTEACWLATVALHGAGWRITAPAAVPVLAFRAERDADRVYRDRVQRVRGARRMLTGEHGVLRPRSFTMDQRLAALAWSVRPLSSLRRVAFIAVLCGALLAGEVPFTASIAVMAVLWAPYFVYTSVAVSLLSGWTLRPGDRTRWSLHNIGATLNSGPDPFEEKVRPPVVNLPSRQYGASLIAAVVMLSVVLVLRGLSDRLTHTMGELPKPALLAMVAVGLWVLALSLDVLRVLGRRSQVRRATRVGAALSASLGDRGVTLVDLTALGAGVVSHAGFEVGERTVLEAMVPTRTGVTSMTVQAVVRNVAITVTGEWRLGLEFLEVDEVTADALAEFCVIEPAWEELGITPGISVTDPVPMVPVPEVVHAHGAGRTALRLVSLFALVGAVASSLPARAEASALTPRWSGTVVLDVGGDGIDGVVVTAVCRDAPGQPVTATTDALGRFSVPVPGDQCHGFVSPPEGMRVTFDSTSSRIALTRGRTAIESSNSGVLVAQLMSVGTAADEELRNSLSLVVMALIAVIAGSLLIGLRPRRELAVA